MRAVTITLTATVIAVLWQILCLLEMVVDASTAVVFSKASALVGLGLSALVVELMALIVVDPGMSCT